ncbi:unnamed protein product [Ectocarpus fasciculatus]
MLQPVAVGPPLREKWTYANDGPTPRRHRQIIGLRRRKRLPVMRKTEHLHEKLSIVHGQKIQRPYTATGFSLPTKKKSARERRCHGMVQASRVALQVGAFRTWGDITKHNERWPGRARSGAAVVTMQPSSKPYPTPRPLQVRVGDEISANSDFSFTSHRSLHNLNGRVTLAPAVPTLKYMRRVVCGTSPVPTMRAALVLTPLLKGENDALTATYRWRGQERP